MSKNKQWYFTVEFDEDKIRQHGTTVEDVRAAINGIAERKGMTEETPGTWVTKPDAKEWLANCLTLNYMADTPAIMDNLKKVTYHERDSVGHDLMESVRKIDSRVI